MSLLNETISSFFPMEAYDHAFFGNPWFQKNYDTQLAVLRLCYAEQHRSIKMWICDEDAFSEHMSFLIHSFDVIHNKFLEDLVSEIDGGDYLLGRGWFCNSSQRQVNVLLIKIHGYSQWINAVSGDFDEHVESIMEQIMVNRQMEQKAVLLGELDFDNVDEPLRKLRRILSVTEDDGDDKKNDKKNQV